MTENLIDNVEDARKLCVNWLTSADLNNKVGLGLPEIDDRYNCWRVAIQSDNDRVGEIVIDASSANIVADKTTNVDLIRQRLLSDSAKKTVKNADKEYRISPLQNTVAFGNAQDLLKTLPEQSIDLIFTSPPYYNAKPEYTEYATYDRYLETLTEIFKGCHRVLGNGRFFVINSSPVLIRRVSRNQSSKRIAVPFDIHNIMVGLGFDFVDDIIWVKPEGAGWATGRGRRFAADRNPLQYKPVPVTEYVMVYRRHSERLIDWHIRKHPDKELVKASRIGDDYERTNIWKINPVTRSKHPASFPKKLAERVIRYYSFVNDVVLDPFAGSGTVGQVAQELGRRFVLFENNTQYFELIKSNTKV